MLVGGGWGVSQRQHFAPATEREGMGTRLERLLSVLSELVPVVTLGVMVLLFVLGRWQLALASMVIGWFILPPVIETIDSEVGTDGSSAGGESTREDPLDELRRRYTDGEIDEVEFERRLETLLATEDSDLETARERLDSRDRQVERE